MKRNFIIDKEITLSSENDLLKTKIYSDNLSQIIQNTEKNKVFTIGLFGNWGTGKSSIIETTKNEIEISNKNIKFITYDAWKYANDSFRRMFLLKIQEELRLEQTDEMQRFYQSENADVKPKQTFSIKGLAMVIIVALVGVSIVAGLPGNIEWKIPIMSIIPLLSLLVVVINGVFHNLKISINKPALFAPEQFESCFKQMMEKSLEKKSFVMRNYNKIVEYVRRGETSIINLDKIVIVIDNIDRCHNSMAYQYLTDIKTFLSNEKYNIVFIIPVDDEALRKHLFNNGIHSLDSCHKEKEEFLRKFFNVELRIKPYGNIEMYSFANGLNIKYSLGYNNETINLLSKEFATNPRRIIQLFNNLSAELNNYSSEFGSKYETLICAVLIIREEYHEYYNSILKDKKLFLEGLSSRNETRENSNEQIIDQAERDKGTEELKAFLRVTKYITQNIDISVLSKILTNSSSIFDEIPYEIQSAIQTFDSSVLIRFIKNNPALTDVIFSFITSNIADTTAKQIDSEIINYLELVAKVSEEFPINRHYNEKIDESVKSFDSVLSKITAVKSICNYAKLLNSQGLGNLKKSIIDYINTLHEKVPENFKEFCNCTLSYFNSKKDCQVLLPFFEKYTEDNNIDQSINYSSDQWKILISDKIVGNSIKSIEEISLDTDSVKEVIWIFQNKPDIKTEIYSSFFLHIDSLIGEMRNKKKDEILLYLDFMMLFLNIFKDGQLTSEYQFLYDKFFKIRGIANPNYPSYTQYDNQVEIIEECKENQNESQKIIDFLLKTYAVTNNHISIINELSKEAINYRHYINSHLINLLNRGLDLIPLSRLILEDENYSTDEAIALIKYCFIQRNLEGNLCLAKEQIKTKIKSVIESVKSNKKLISLLMRLKEEQEIHTIIVNEIISHDSVFINELPEELLEMAIDSFNNETAEDFSSNYEFLSVIGNKGTAQQLHILIKLLCKKFDKIDEFEPILNIIEKNSTKITTDDSDLLSYHLNDCINTRVLDEAIKERMKNIIKVLPSKKKK